MAVRHTKCKRRGPTPPMRAGHLHREGRKKRVLRLSDKVSICRRLPRGKNWFDQAWIIVLDVADPSAHRPTRHFIRRVWREKGFELARVRRLLNRLSRETPFLSSRDPAS